MMAVMQPRMRSMKTSNQMLITTNFRPIIAMTNVGYHARGISAIHSRREGNTKKLDGVQEETPVVGQMNQVGENRRRVRTVDNNPLRSVIKNAMKQGGKTEIKPRPNNTITVNLKESHTVSLNDEISYLLDKRKKEDAVFNDNLKTEIMSKDEKEALRREAFKEKLYALTQTNVPDFYELKMVEYLLDSVEKSDILFERHIKDHVLHYYPYSYFHAFTELPQEPEVLTPLTMYQYISSLVQYDFGEYSGSKSLVSKILALIVAGEKHKYLRVASYNLIMAHFFQTHQTRAGADTLDIMMQRNIKPNRVTLDHLLRSYYSFKSANKYRQSFAKFIMDLIEKYNMVPRETTWYLVYIALNDLNLRMHLFQIMKLNGFKFLNVLNIMAHDLAIAKLNILIESPDFHKLKSNPNILNEFCLDILIDIKKEVYQNGETHIDRSTIDDFKRYELSIFNGIISALLKLDLVEEAASFLEYSGILPNHSTFSRFIVYFTSKNQLWYALATLNYIHTRYQHIRTFSPALMTQSTINPIYASLREAPPFLRKFTVARIAYSMHTLTYKKIYYSPNKKDNVYADEVYNINDDVKDFKINILNNKSKNFTDGILNGEFKQFNDLRYRDNYTVDSPDLDEDELEFKKNVFEKITFLTNGEVPDLHNYKLTQEQINTREAKYKKLFAIGNYKRDRLKSFVVPTTHVRSFVDLERVRTDSDFREMAKQLGYTGKLVTPAV